jgi:tetratricopeptide (TPR) repeat protein
MFAADFHLNRLARAHPWDASLRIALAHLSARQGKRQESATHLTQAILLDPRVSLWPIDPKAAERGERAARAGDWRLAVLEFRVASQQPRGAAESIANLLQAQRSARDAPGVGQTMAELARRLPAETDSQIAVSLIDIAISEEWAKPVSSALLERTRSNLAASRNASTLHFHGAALYRSGNYAEAERILAESGKAQGEGGFETTRMFQALVAQKRGKHAEAVRLLTRLEQWHRGQQFSTWQAREWWDTLLGEARRLIRPQPTKRP